MQHRGVRGYSRLLLRRKLSMILEILTSTIVLYYRSLTSKTLYNLLVSKILKVIILGDSLRVKEM